MPSEKHPLKLKPAFRPMSLPAQLVGVLRGDIGAQKFGPVLPGERQLAVAYHVSRATMRRVIEALTDERLLARKPSGRLVVAAGTGPAPAASRGAGASGIGHVGFITRFRMHELARHELIWLDRLREMLAISGFRLTIHSRADIYHKEPRSHLRLLMEEYPKTIWLLHRSTPAMQAFFPEAGIPAIVVGSPHEGSPLPSVENDQYALSFNAAILARRRGYEHLVFLYNDDSAAGVRLGMRGLSDGVARAGLRLTLKRYEYDVSPALDSLLALAGQKRERCVLLVDAACSALRAMTWLMGKGVRFPRDLGLFCRDSAGYLDECCPAVEHYAFDPLALAQKAHRCVLHLGRGESLRGKSFKIIPEFVRGGSL
jgi:DNA-binding LacI/PurR family transcriptional regulator